jgi:hypothetical protein
MAKVIDQHLGALRGKMGPQVFKMHGSEAFATRVPHRIIVPPSVETVERRNRFRNTAKMANKVQSIKPMKYIWKNYQIPDEVKNISASNKIIKTIYPKMTGTGPKDTLSIVPDNGFKVIPDVTVSNSLFTAEIQPLGTSSMIDSNVEVSICMACVGYFSVPVDPDNSAKSRFIGLVSDSILLTLNNSLTFNIELGEYYGQVYDDYSNKKLFFALVTADAKEIPVHFSNTFRKN